MKHQKVDLCIIGGGIYGATVFWEAVSRGLNVVLLEQNDFASGVSGNSLKTIHGGFRYLQQVDIARTLKSDREKRILRSIAEPLIAPLTCCIPASKSLKNNSFTYRLASMVMNSLCWLGQKLDAVGKASELGFSAVTVKNQNPFFNSVSSKSNHLVWQDAQVIDSERLVMTFINAGKKAGGRALNYCAAKSIDNADKQGFVVTTAEHQIQTKYIADCTSSFALAQENGFLPTTNFKSTEYVSAVNLVLDQQFSEQAFALQSNIGDLDKQGLLFFSPWKGSTLAGTWYFEAGRFNSAADIDDETLSQCVLDVSNTLQSAGIEIDAKAISSMLIDIHFGVLPASEGNSAAESRLIANNQIQLLSPNFWRVQSTKYTMARACAESLINKMASANSQITESNTHSSKLLCSISSGDSNQQILFDRYGDAAKLMCQTKLEFVPSSDRFFQQEVMFLIKNEQVKKLSDMLYRRLNTNHHQLFKLEEIDWIAKAMKSELSWSDQELERNFDEVREREAFKERLKGRVCS